jgi:two-component system NtrC family sensor kinase
VIVEVQDTGVGIAPEDVSKIFEPFYTTKEIGKGTGLGLAVCYGIITEHEGRLSVRSTLGAGTTFTLFLPVYKLKSDA